MRAHPLQPIDLHSTPRDVVLRLARSRPAAAVLAALVLVGAASLVSYEVSSSPAKQPAEVTPTAIQATPVVVPIVAPVEESSIAASFSAAPAATSVPAADVAAVASAASAGTATAVSTPILVDEGIAKALVQRYYTAINGRDYQSAYDVLTAKWHQRQGYADFAGGYAGTRRDTLTILAAGPASQAGTPGYVLTVDVVAETTSGRTQHFNGLYFVILEGGQPKIDSGRLTTIQD
jgi:hypothetical protein